MQISGIKNQSLIPNKNEVKTDKKPSDSDKVTLSDSGTKMDDILNYKNLAEQKAGKSKEDISETCKTIIGTGVGAMAGSGLSLLAGVDPKSSVALAILGAGAGFIGTETGVGPGIAIGAGTGAAMSLLAGVTGGGVVGFAVTCGFIGGILNMCCLNKE
jgi:hypothetical protein